MKNEKRSHWNLKRFTATQSQHVKKKAGVGRWSPYNDGWVRVASVQVTKSRSLVFIIIQHFYKRHRTLFSGLGKNSANFKQ